MTLTVETLNSMVEALVGPGLIDNWWDSPNYAFDLKTPKEMYEVDPEAVCKYLLGHINGDYM